MAYVAVKGGDIAIKEAIELTNYNRAKSLLSLGTDLIENSLKALIDQVMSESSLYDEKLASIAIKQAKGSSEEAVFLLRAYRSTLSRRYTSRTLESRDMDIKRRISSSFKDVIGGQILGASSDYSHRLLDFDLCYENREKLVEIVKDYKDNISEKLSSKINYDEYIVDGNLVLPSLKEFFYKNGFLDSIENDDREPDDITKKSITFPSTRSERLQTLTRSQSYALSSLAYAAIRGFSEQHPTIAELRIGDMEIFIENPMQVSENSKEEDDYYIGKIEITEVESLIPIEEYLPNGMKELDFKIGYGAVFGTNETKAISMSIIDSTLENKSDSYLSDEEFVLLHIDTVESSGFISHLKLPHYVTFASELDAFKKSREAKNAKQSL